MSQSSSHSSQWFACYHPRPEAKLRLIGFPHGGGGPQAFREWGKLLPDEIEVVALSLPGRGSRLDEPLITSIDELVPQVVEALTDYFDKPFVFFGHSQGSLAAFEIVRYLEQKGYPLPLHLFVSAYKAPQLTFDGPTFYKLSDGELMAWIRQLGLVPADVMEHEELLELILSSIRGDFEMVETYPGWDQASPISIPMTALAGHEDALLNEADLQAWSECTTSNFGVQMFGGGHFYTQSHQAQVIPFIAQKINETIAVLPKSLLIAERYSNPGKCFHELFREQAAKTPDQVAIINGERQVTFRELDQQSDLLARYLQSQGVTVDTPVGIYMGTSIEYLVACLSALKAGGPFMQISLAYPEALLERVLESAEPVFILTNKRLHARLPATWQELAFNMDTGWQDTLLRQEIEVPGGLPKPTIDSLYHVIFTSGTTGTPKGVISSHRAHFNAMLWYFAHYPYQEGERVASNIFLMWETMQPLLNGVPTVIIPNDVIYDPRRLVEFLSEHQITRATFTPSLMEQLLNLPQLDLSEKLPQMRMIVWSAEMVTTSLRNRTMARLPHVKFVNEYGLSEIYINCVNDMREVDVVLSPKFTSVGKPLFNNRTYVLDEKREPVPMGFTGEIYMAGDSLSYGYLKLPEKTAERFLPDTIVNDGSKMLRTGDAGRILPNGQLEVQGRIDFIVKIRGFRVAPRAIETTIIEHPAVNVAAVTTLDNESGQPEQLVAYIVGEGVGEGTDSRLLADVRSYLKDKLPHYAIPAYLIPLDALPIAATGKLDRRKLPKPEEAVTRLSGAMLKEPPETRAEKALAEVWQAVLGIESVDATANFFDLGGHSLLAAELVNQLRDSLNLDLSVVDLFQYPTLRALAESVSDQFGATVEHGSVEHGQIEHGLRENTTKPPTHQSTNPPIHQAINPPIHQSTNPDIAIIGMACRFPGADDVEQFWENLRDGVCSIRELTDKELEQAGIGPELYNRPDYVKFGGILDDVDQFEPSFWGLSKREAEVMDPQQRLFLEACWQALEHAGHPPSKDGAQIGVFGGADFPWYLLYHLRGGEMLNFTDRTMMPVTEFGNDKDYLATRVSYLLNLRGPSMTIQTACSTGLVAAATACQALQSGQCDMALAGGVSVIFPQAGYQYIDGFYNSPDGQCRAFDANAAGTLFTNGVGVVLMKRLEDAKADGDHILAVIKGYGINNDGHLKAGYSAPSVQGQVEMLAKAYTSAGLSPDTISYVEAHGTGTLVGDPIEVRALTTVFGQATDKIGHCVLGSLKPNIGHASNAAGIAGLIKTVLALHHRQIPPTINFETPNPALELEHSPFVVNNRLRQWTAANGTPRRAGVTSLGIGGTNCHIVLEEWLNDTPQDTNIAPAHHLLTLSAKTAKSLKQNRLNLARYLNKHPDVNLADVAYTLHQGRQPFEHRLAVTCHDVPSAIQALKRGQEAQATLKQPSIVFMFPGGGAQYLRMASGLYHDLPTFRQHFDACCAITGPLLGVELGELLYGEEAEEGLKRFSYLHPAMFVVEYSLARTLMDWGLQPAALVGHSLSEYVAACLAGVLRLEDALALVITRSAAMEQIGIDGAMLAVNMSQKEAEYFLETRYADADGSYVGIAVINSPTSVVLSGHNYTILDVERELEKDEVMFRRVKTAKIASHSPLMREAAETIIQNADSIEMHAPTIPLALNLTGNWQPDNQPLEPSYWGQQVLSVVCFEDNMRTILQEKPSVILEVGPGRSLTRIVNEILAHWANTNQPLILPTMRHRLDTDTHDAEFLWQTLGQLWQAGIKLDWQAIHAEQQPQPRRIPLPTYAFERSRCWLDLRHQDRLLTQRAVPLQHQRDMKHPLLGQRLQLAVQDKQSFFENWLSPESASYIADHRLYGQIIFPITGFLEMALAAGREMMQKSVVVEDIFFTQAMILSEKQQTKIQTVLKVESEETGSFQIFSLNRSDDKHTSWTLHAHGRVVASQVREHEQAVDIRALQSRFWQALSVERFYDYQQEKLMVDYGPSLHLVSQLWKNENEALALIEVPTDWPLESYQFHPALLDGFLQAAWAIFFDENDDNQEDDQMRVQNQSWVDVSCERLILFGSPRSKTFWSHARLRSVEDTLRVTDLSLYDEEGKLVAELRGLIEQRVSQRQFLTDEMPWQDWLYEVTWQPQTARTPDQASSTIKPKHWLILADSAGYGRQLAKNLTALGETCTLVWLGDAYQQLGQGEFSITNQLSQFKRLLDRLGEVHEIVNLWSLDGHDHRFGHLSAEKLLDLSWVGCGSTLHLIQAIFAQELMDQVPSLWLVTSGAQAVTGACPGFAQSPLWGMSRAIRQEHPELNCVCLDLDPESHIESNAQILCRELVADHNPSIQREDQIAFRNQARYVARWSSINKNENLAEKLSIPMAFDNNSTYLITGGLGGLGLLLTEWMVERGARHLVLVSRSTDKPEAKRKIRQLLENQPDAHDVQITLTQADVSVLGQLAQVLADIDPSWPLAGIIHAAGAYDDALLLDLTQERLIYPFISKVQGSWNLHQLTREMPLTFFVSFSSLASRLENGGQANYSAANAFLDALGHYRQEQGLPALSIAWGAWSQIGSSANARTRQHLKKMGFDMIVPEEGVEVLEAAWRFERAYLAVSPINWARFATYAARIAPFWAKFAPKLDQNSPESKAPWPEAVFTQDEANTSRASLQIQVCEQVAQILGIDSSQVDPDQNFFNLGLDSLTSLGLRNRLQTSLGCGLPATLIFKYPTVKRLVDYLSEEMISDNIR